MCRYPMLPRSIDGLMQCLRDSMSTTKTVVFWRLGLCRCSQAGSRSRAFALWRSWRPLLAVAPSPLVSRQPEGLPAQTRLPLFTVTLAFATAPFPRHLRHASSSPIAQPASPNHIMAPTTPVDLALTSLLPTLSPLPPELIELSHSLLAQSRHRASSMKPEEEIGRTYACCHIACERLGKKLSLEIGRAAPPVKPAVYARLKRYLGVALRTPASTPRRLEKRGVREGLRTPGARTTVEEVVGRETRSAGAVTPGKSSAGGTPATSASGRKRKAEEMAAREEAVPEAAQGGVEAAKVASFAPSPLPAHGHGKRPAKTPLRRQEKHAKRRGLGGPEDLGPAGLLPGLGTMFQPAVDWLGEGRREEFVAWKDEMMREIAMVESGKG